MKVLVIADVESKSLWDYYSPDKLEGVDLIISCGDLNPNYLQFLVTLSGRTLVYVRGNHDERYDKNPPDGCICIENMIYNYKGLRIAGLGGSMRYKYGPDMYTEAEMRKRARRLAFKIRYTNGIDILVTHAPVKGYGDMQDLPHRGFECFGRILEKYKPLYLLHGHVHKNYGARFQRVTGHPCGTSIVNAYESYAFEIPKTDYPAFAKTGSYFYDLQCRLGEENRVFYKNPV